MPNIVRRQPVSRIVTFVLVLALAALMGAAAIPAPSAAMTGAKAAAQTQAPPALVESVPAPGATWDGSPVRLVFDRAMAPDAAAQLTIAPALAGETAVDDNAVIFTPTDTPAPGQRYVFTLAAKATDAEGVPLGRDVTVAVVAAAPLEVTSTQPSDGVTDVGIDTPIMVIFNRPIVPLTGVDGQAALPQPLVIDPPVDGTGEWVNTSIYAFTPANGLAGGTEYSVTVADVTAADGTTLAAPVTFSITTAAPSVVHIEPIGMPVAPDAEVRMVFSQPMDRATTQAAFAMTPTLGSDRTVVSGSFTWQDRDTAFTFTPDEPLEFGQKYLITVDDSALAAGGEITLTPFTQVTHLQVVQLPEVQGTIPADGDTNVPTDRAVTIQFNVPLSATTVLPNIDVSPRLTTTRVYSIYNEYMDQVLLNWFMEANTSYTVTVGAEIADPYGNTLDEETVIRFTTGDHPPYTRINLDRFTHFSAATSPTVSAYYRNMDTLTVDLYRLPLDELYRVAGVNQWEVWQNYMVPDADANRIWQRDYKPEVGPNVTGEIYIDLNDADANLLPTGVYLLEINSPDVPQPDPNTPPTREQKVIVLSDNNIVIKRSDAGQSLAWLTDLATGEPVAGAPVQFVEETGPLADGVTDADGLFVADVPLSRETPWAPTFAVSGQPGDAEFAVVSTDWNQGIGAWEYGIPYGYGLNRSVIYAYTDRPIYRPGQTVYWKAILRLLDVEAFSVPPVGTSMDVVVRDDRGNEIYRGQHTTNDFGTINGAVTLAPEAVSGYYWIEIRASDAPPEEYGGGANFQVASYRAPEFEMSVTPGAAEYVSGDTVEAVVEARYFSGGPLADADVRWTVLASPYTFDWQNGPDDRYFSFQAYDPNQFDFDPFRTTYYGGIVREGTGRTDAQGRYTISLPADLMDSPGSQNWRFEVTLQSSTNQFVSGGANTIVHKSDFYVGLSPRAAVVNAGEEATVDIVALEAMGAPDNAPYPGAALDVTVYEFAWNSVYEKDADGQFRWRTDVQRTPVYSTTVTTDRDGMASVAWTPDRGGQYQVEAVGEDDNGVTVSAATYVWVSDTGGDFVAWPRENNDRMELVRDKELYAPGDTAKILIPSPFTPPAQALVTLERGGVLETQLIDITSNSQTLEVPITSAHIPNVYVSVVLVKGVDESNPTPGQRIGYVELPVDIAEKELAVTIEPSADTVAPAEIVGYALTVQDLNGDPVPAAEVSVALVDKAVLSLSDIAMSPMADVFYYRRPLGVRTGSLLIINRDRLSQQLSEGAKGGGGGGGMGGALEIREEFADLAFWRADFVTDEAGRIDFEVTLPDNLTTWVLMAKAVDNDTRVGEAENEIVATKALQVRPVLPRFFTGGDRARIGAVVVNTTADPVSGTLTFALDGATVEQGDLTQSFALDAGAQTRVDWTIAVPTAAGADVIAAWTADAEPLSDAVRLTVPVNRYQTPETVATSGSVPAEGRTETIVLPPDATDDGALVVGVQGSLAGGMISGLDYLEHFPYECNEQTVSRFLPNLFTVRALDELGISSPDLSDKLAFEMGVGVQRLLSRQNPDGGWGYWPGEESSPFITSYVLWGLTNAQAQGFTVADERVDAAASYLDRTFQAPDDVTADWMLNEMAFTHFVLAEIGRGDPGRASTLYDARERLALYGKAYLAMALDDMAGDAGDPRIDTLLDDLFGATQYSATGASWHEDDIDFRTLNTDTRTTAIVLAAFIRLDPNHPMLEQVVRWLMSAREAGRWSSTQETAWSIIALTDWLTVSRELEGNYDWTVTLNDGEPATGTVGPDNVTVNQELSYAITDLLRDQANVLRLDRSNDSGRMYYTTELRYYLDAMTVDARDRGVVVTRSFATDAGPVNSAAVGDVISVTVGVIVPADRYHLMVEVPIPAGTEPVDRSLATERNDLPGPEFGATEETANGPRFGYWTPTYVDIRDDKLALFATYLPAGAYEFTFPIRATVPGEYRVLPVHAEQMYFPEVWGRSAG
ncbi:MAG: Ig-like domain-containing protein [Caldilineaceae bacterium]